MYQLYQRVAQPDDPAAGKIGGHGQGSDFTEEVRGLRTYAVVAADAGMAPPSHYVEVFKLPARARAMAAGWRGSLTGGHALAILQASPTTTSATHTVRGGNARLLA
jgi:hypothetical protein